MAVFRRTSNFISGLKSCVTGCFKHRQRHQQTRSQDVSDYYMIILKLTGEIDRRYLSSNIIYRHDGSTRNVRRLCNALLKTASKVHLKNEYSVTISSAIKRLLRKVQVIPTDVATELHNIVKLHWNIDGKHNGLSDLLCTALKTSIHRMPYENFSILKLLIMHLKKFTLHQKQCDRGMTAEDLGNIFGPSFSDEYDNFTAFESKSFAIRWKEIIKMLIENSDTIFGKTYMISTRQLKRETTTSSIILRQRKDIYKKISRLSPEQPCLYRSCLLKQANETEERLRLEKNELQES